LEKLNDQIDINFFGITTTWI